MAVIASDNFTRANSTTSLGVTPVGNFTWQKYGNQQWGIQSNQAYAVSIDYDQANYIDVGVSDYVAYQARLAVKSSTSQLMYRYMSDGNGFCIEANKLYKVIGNAFTEVGVVGAYASGDLIRIELRGNEHKIFWNGSLVLTYVDSYAMTGTKFGFSTQNTTTRIDDVLIETIDPPVATSTNLYQTEDFADNTYIWPITQGTNGWTRANTAAPNGNTGHIASNAIGDNATASVSFALNIPAAAISGKMEVDWSVSSETGYDFFRIRLDGAEVFAASGTQSGTASFPTGTGSKTVTFEYVKDGSTVSGNDKAYVSEARLYADVAVNPVQIGVYRCKIATKTVSIPIYSITNFQTEALRVNTTDGIGFMLLVPTTDPAASPIRLQTTKGLRALKL